MFANLNLKNKILVATILPILFMGLINLVAIVNYNQVIETYTWVDHSREVIEDGQEIIQSAINMETGERGYLLTGDESFLEPYQLATQDYQKRFAATKPLVTDEAALQALTKAEQLLQTWQRTIADNYIQQRKAQGDTPEGLKAAMDNVSSKQGKVLFDEFRDAMDEFFARQHTLLQKRQQEANATTNFTNNLIIIGTALGLLAAAIIALFMSNMITAPIIAIRDAANKISKGQTDIELDIHNQDELGEMSHAFKTMTQTLNRTAQTAQKLSLGEINVEVLKRSDEDVLGVALQNLVENLRTTAELAHKIGNGDLTVAVSPRSEQDVFSSALQNLVHKLNQIMSEIKESTAVLGSAASEIMATSAQVSSSAVQTTSAVAETSASIEEIKQTARISSSKATHTAQSTEQALQNANSGRQALEENMSGLNQIKEKMDLIGSNIVQLSEHSQMIGEIITTVEDIANQSNLLAVNASIEAVKAGEHGKGFSVVAQELKNLAEQSKDGTKQVQKILLDIQKMTGTLVMVAEQGGHAVTHGIKQAQNAKNSITTLNQSVADSARAGQQIAASYEQELAGMEQIANAMASVKDAMGQNTDSIRQVEESARNLNLLSQKLSMLLEQYKVAN